MQTGQTVVRVGQRPDAVYVISRKRLVIVVECMILEMKETQEKMVSDEAY